MFKRLAAFLLAMHPLLTVDHSGQAVDSNDKPFFMRSFEHALPSVLEYREAGLYGARNTPYAVSLRFREGQWDVQLERAGQLLYKARLDKAYNRIPISRIIVASLDGDRQYVVSIPFGTPHTECFANGDEVYSQLDLQSDGNIKLQHFPGCMVVEATLQTAKSNQSVLVGPPIFPVKK